MKGKFLIHIFSVLFFNSLRSVVLLWLTVNKKKQKLLNKLKGIKEKRKWKAKLNLEEKVINWKA